MQTRLSFADEADVDEFARVLARFERGDITADAWRLFRLVRGTYGQRQSDDAQMLRVKMPQGLLSSAQLHAVADVADRYSRGFAHITTRQNIQFHFVRLADVEPAMRRLAGAGLTTREACGNSVRNITACPYAGVSVTEAFDVTPYAEAMTRHLLRHPLSSRLPRKFKIGFEACRDDHARLGINDLGFRGVLGAQGARGFRVTIAGGTSIMPRTGAPLHDFVPAGGIFDVADAVLRVYAAHGDYQHKQRNRLKFLIKTLGWEGWHAAYLTELAALRSESSRAFPFDPDRPPVEEAPSGAPRTRPSLSDLVDGAMKAEVRGPGLLPRRPSAGAPYAAWRRSNVLLQKQPGYAMAVATVPLGDLTSAQFRLLAELAGAFGDGVVRVTVDQNVVFRWVRIDQLEAFHASLSAIGLGLDGAFSIADVVSCPGAESCRLAVTQSRGLGRLLGDHLRASPQLAAAAGPAGIKISGCPNGCAQHHVAAIGFQGSIRKVGGRALPQYFVLAGGGPDGEGEAFGRIVAKVPARRCPEAVDRLVGLYETQHTAGESLAAFLRRAEPAALKAALADLEPLAEADAQERDFIDLGETAAFSPEVMDGECSA